MKNKGFTLIELLAVIVILAIIALIAVPIILNIIGQAKEKSRLASVELISSTAELYYANSILVDDSNLTGNLYDKVVNNMNGEMPSNGQVYVDKNGNIAFALSYDNYCYTKEFSSPEINKERTDNCVAPINYLAVSQNTSETATFLNGNIPKNKIEAIEFVTNIDVPENALGRFDASEKQNGSILAWYFDNDNNGLYELYIGEEGGVKANPNSGMLFLNFKSLKKLNLEYLDTSNSTNIMGMFRYCSSLTELDLSSLNTKNVVNMMSLFSFSSNLERIIGLENLNTSKVTDVAGMFQGCSSLIELDVSHFDTRNVSTMLTMFSSCTNLKKIKGLEKFDTSKVNNMRQMFVGCSSLTSLDVSHFDTSNVTNIEGMFSDCSSLTELDLSNFNTSNVIDMTLLFNKCRSLEHLNLGKFDNDRITSVYCMFNECNSLKELDLSNFN